jgi:arylsulfatase A-like enzyme
MERAYDFIKENKDTNFFMYLPFTIPHGPLEVPELGIYENKDWEENAKILAAMITRMDTDVGKVVDLLKELGIDENTIIFYTSDNGTHKVYKDFFNSATAFRGEKTTMYEGGLRVPFIARWPGRIEAGSTSDNISAFWDVMPTIADLTGTKAPLEIDGISFAPTLFGQEQKQHHHLYWEYYGHKGAIALRKGKWKLVRNDLHKNYYTAPVELYNLEEDIAESTNVASEHPEVVEDLLGLVKASHSPNALHKFRSQ